MKKIFQIIGFFTLLIFTFTYTSKITMVIKENDKLLKQIEDIENQYIIEPINATIKDNTIIAGISGSKINVKESYKKMKKIDEFNTNLLVYESIKPEISVLDYYDKYIIKSNKNEVSLLFLVEQNNNIEKILNILNILNNYEIKATFYVDGNWFENNNEKIIDLIEDGHTIGNLGYNYSYNVNGISWMNTIVTKIGNQKLMPIFVV